MPDFNITRLFIFLLGFYIFSSDLSFAQCQCFASAGNPVGGTQNRGTMGNNSLRLAPFYNLAYSGKYFKADKPYYGKEGALKAAYYNYAGMLAAYGLTDKFTLEAEAG